MHGPMDTMSWFSDHGVELKTEHDGRVFPATNSSSTIIDCLISEARRRGVVLETGKTVTSVSTTAGGKLSVKVEKRTVDYAEHTEVEYLMITSGSSEQGYKLAAQLGHSIVNPVPSLFTFKIDDFQLVELSGVTFPKVRAKLKLETVQKSIPEFTQVGPNPMLVTHWGFSGPVILRLSAWGARDFSDSNYRGTLLLDFIPDLHLEDLKTLLIGHEHKFAKQKVTNSFPSEFGLVKRFWRYILEHEGLDGDLLWAYISNNSLISIASRLKNCSFLVKGKGVFKDEFVTAGGVPVSEISLSTMQSRIQSHLFFAGEVLNLDGVTGGFNFQEAQKMSGEQSSVAVPEDGLINLKGYHMLPDKIKKKLYAHQMKGLEWLLSIHLKEKGGILGDDMGLGKTLQVCSFISILFHSDLMKKALIILPTMLLTPWKDELEGVGLEEKTREYVNSRTRQADLQYILKNGGILLSTYGIVRNNVNSLCGDSIWDYVILDEGHTIKESTTQTAKRLRQIPCRHRIIVTGTPIMNNLKELWALFYFCNPELLDHEKKFEEKYICRINRGLDRNASAEEKRAGTSAAQELQECIKPYFLRRMKNEIFKDESTLPKKNEITIWLRLTDFQRKLYEAILHKKIPLSDSARAPFVRMMILSHICDHPLLLRGGVQDVWQWSGQKDNRAEKLAKYIADVEDRIVIDGNQISCKILFILSLLEDLVPKGHSVLIFSQSLKMLDLIQESLTAKQYEYNRIDGHTKRNNRDEIVKKFQEGHGAPIFLLTSKVGGLGLTLTYADRVIVVDPAWNPSIDSQSVDRVYRLGQKKDVIVYRLITCGTIEEMIYKKQVFKEEVIRSVTEYKEFSCYFSSKELNGLFKVPKGGFDISETQEQLVKKHDEENTLKESLRAHIDFLKTLGIAGVSQHSLLFSKAEAHLQEQEAERPSEVIADLIATRERFSKVANAAKGAHKAEVLKRIAKVEAKIQEAIQEEEKEKRQKEKSASAKLQCGPSTPRHTQNHKGKPPH